MKRRTKPRNRERIPQHSVRSRPKHRQRAAHAAPPHNHAHKRTGIRQHGLVGHARKGTDFRNTLRIQRLDSALVRGRMLRNSDPCVRKTGLRGAVYTAPDCPSDDRPPSQVGAVEGEGAPPGAGPLSGVGAPPGVGAGSGAPTRRTTRGSPVGWADPPWGSKVKKISLPGWGMMSTKE